VDKLGPEAVSTASADSQTTDLSEEVLLHLHPAATTETESWLGWLCCCGRSGK
jgi:hypothetical protein